MELVKRPDSSGIAVVYAEGFLGYWVIRQDENPYILLQSLAYIIYYARMYFWYISDIYIYHFFRILMNQAVKRAMALPGMFTSTWMIKWRNLNKREQCDVCDVELFTQKHQQRNMWRTLKKNPRFLVMHFETLCDINCCRTRALLQWFVSRDTGSFTAKHLYGLWRGCPLTGGRTMSLILFEAEHKVLASILQPFEAFPGLLMSLMTHSHKWFFIQSFKESQISIFSMGFLSSGPLTAELFAEAKDIFLEHMKDQKGSICDSSCSSSVALLCFSLDCHGQLFLHKRCCFGYSKGFYILTEVHLLTSFRCNITLPFLATADWWCNHCSDRRLWKESNRFKHQEFTHLKINMSPKKELFQ